MAQLCIDFHNLHNQSSSANVLYSGVGTKRTLVFIAATLRTGDEVSEMMMVACYPEVELKAVLECTAKDMPHTTLCRVVWGPLRDRPPLSDGCLEVASRMLR